jgi:hypothetical protein
METFPDYRATVGLPNPQRPASVNNSVKAYEKRDSFLETIEPYKTVPSKFAGGSHPNSGHKNSMEHSVTPPARNSAVLNFSSALPELTEDVFYGRILDYLLWQISTRQTKLNYQPNASFDQEVTNSSDLNKFIYPLLSQRYHFYGLIQCIEESRNNQFFNQVAQIQIRLATTQSYDTGWNVSSRGKANKGPVGGGLLDSLLAEIFRVFSVADMSAYSTMTSAEASTEAVERRKRYFKITQGFLLKIIKQMKDCEYKLQYLFRIMCGEYTEELNNFPTLEQRKEDSLRSAKTQVFLASIFKI